VFSIDFFQIYERRETREKEREREREQLRYLIYILGDEKKKTGEKCLS
jgi:hypothetical protein